MIIPKKQLFIDCLPQGYFLDLDNQGDLFSYLKNKAWFTPDEQLVNINKAGEGNMNFTVRIKTTKKSYILKQARPWVEKFPEIEAPIQRNYIEKAFYDQVAQDDFLATQMPKVLQIIQIDAKAFWRMPKDSKGFCRIAQICKKGS